MQKQTKKTNKNTQKQNKAFKQKLSIAITASALVTVLIITSILAIATWGFTAQTKADLWSFKKPVQSAPVTPDAPTEPTEPQVPGQLAVGKSYSKVTIKDYAGDWSESDIKNYLTGCDDEELIKVNGQDNAVKFEIDGVTNYTICPNHWGCMTLSKTGSGGEAIETIFQFIGTSAPSSVDSIKKTWRTGDQGAAVIEKTYIFDTPIKCTYVQNAAVIAEFFYFE